MSIERRSGDRRKREVPWETLLAFVGLLVAMLTGGWSIYAGIDGRLRHIEVEVSAIAQEVKDMQAPYDSTGPKSRALMQ